ncbi:hypothetical protein ACJIZ3_009400 [Penstemon smallii]|uniref:DAGKc domain-containing protein n=1 Tax=Penstemon smallii TaxID=265156 RepID=A0ABD3TCF3_9LAMI
MERNENGLLGDDSDPNASFTDAEGSIYSSDIFLDYVGEVILSHDSDVLSWKFVESLQNEEDKSSCLGMKFVSKNETEVKFSDIYAVDLIGWGPVHASAGKFLFGQSSESEMYRFAVHVVLKSKNNSSHWIPSVYTFGHKNLEICKTWVTQINSYLETEAKRPKSLMVFVHPKSGKGQGRNIWEAVAPLFSQAKVKTKVIVTERAGHARDVLASITNKELSSFDGVVAVGGDGFFNEILNGLLLSRHKAPYPPTPGDSKHPIESECNVSTHSAERTVAESRNSNEDQSPLLLDSEHIVPQSPNSEQEPSYCFPNELFRFGIIPAGSTDAIVICTTGARDPVTSALHIVLGKKVCLDIAQVVRWKKTHDSKVEPCLRYAASFAGYGFYGDVITESEKYRWMGPKRYDYAGTKVFLQHRSYEAEVNYLVADSEKESSVSPETNAEGGGGRKLWCLRKKSDRVSCRANCTVCNDTVIGAPNLQGLKWLKSKGRFLSIGAAVISCRNEKAPDADLTHSISLTRTYTFSLQCSFRISFSCAGTLFSLQGAVGPPWILILSNIIKLEPSHSNLWGKRVYGMWMVSYL